MLEGYIYVYRQGDRTLIQITDDLERTHEALQKEYDGQMVLQVRVKEPREVRGRLHKQLMKFKEDDKGWFKLPVAWRSYINGFLKALSLDDVEEIDYGAELAKTIDPVDIFTLRK